MRPAPFELASPRTLQAALDVLGDDMVRPLAGGQSLIALMNLRLAAPATLVDLTGIPELSMIEVVPGGIRIGAMTRQAEVETSPLVVERIPLVAEALGHVGHWQIRCRGTVGGNLAHSDPASELPAVMQALDAVYHVRSSTDGRTIPAVDFHVGAYETALADGELLTAIDVPALEPGEGSGLVEITRVAGAYAMAGAAATCLLVEGECVRARIAVFAAGSRAVRVAEAEQAARGRRIDSAVLDEVSEATRAAVAPHDDLHATADQRRHLLGVSAARALRRAAERGSGVVA